MYRNIAKIIISLLFILPLFGENINENAQEKAIKDAYSAGLKVMVTGPSQIKISNQATINLPKGFGFIPKTEASNIMYAFGNSVSDEFNGMIVPTSNNEFWYVSVDYVPSGYIKDDDAKDWDADDLLEQYKEGTTEANKERASRNISEIEVVGWAQEPVYYKDKNQVIWSISLKEKNQPNSTDMGVNYNTLVLGREGYISLVLVTDLKNIEALKPISKSLVDNLSFVKGKQYKDVDLSSDKIAEYGLAALITGVVAKKLGLFALIAVFLAKFAKIIAIVVFGGAYAAIKRFFSRKKDSELQSDIDNKNSN